MNKLIHAKYGNMKGKGTAKGKPGKISLTEDSEASFYDDIKASMPQAALERMQPRLFSEDWTIPVRTFAELSALPGIAVVPRAHVPATIRQVGYTRNAVAIVTTQSNVQLGLRAYPCEHIHLHFQVIGDDGEPKEVQTQRYIIQLGFGPPVTMQAVGDRIDLPRTMLKLVIKLPRYFGWTPETIRGNTVTTLISQHIDLQAVENLQCREDGSATFMLHESFFTKLLAASGQDSMSMFIKIHASDEAHFPTELLWLPEDHLASCTPYEHQGYIGGDCQKHQGISSFRTEIQRCHQTRRICKNTWIRRHLQVWALASRWFTAHCWSGRRYGPAGIQRLENS